MCILLGVQRTLKERLNKPYVYYRVQTDILCGYRVAFMGQTILELGLPWNLMIHLTTQIYFGQKTKLELELWTKIFFTNWMFLIVSWQWQWIEDKWYKNKKTIALCPINCKVRSVGRLGSIGSCSIGISNMYTVF